MLCVWSLKPQSGEREEKSKVVVQIKHLRFMSVCLVNQSFAGGGDGDNIARRSLCDQFFIARLATV